MRVSQGKNLKSALVSCLLESNLLGDVGGKGAIKCHKAYCPKEEIKA